MLHPKLQLVSWFTVQQTFQLISLILQMTVQLVLTVHLTWAESSTAFNRKLTTHLPTGFKLQTEISVSRYISAYFSSGFVKGQKIRLTV